MKFIQAITFLSIMAPAWSTSDVRVATSNRNEDVSTTTCESTTALLLDTVLRCMLSTPSAF
jgi:hypothetical protein